MKAREDLEKTEPSCASAVANSHSAEIIEGPSNPKQRQLNAQSSPDWAHIWRLIKGEKSI